ncbi:MAG: glycosyltransferase [Candidatus Sericytochromatia bacterium]
MKISMYWQGELSLYEQACMSSFLSQGFELEVYTYELVSGLPAGARLRDAHELFEQSLSTAYTQGGEQASPTAFSNLVRYQLMAGQGGIWMDTDMLCLKPVQDYAALLERSPDRLIVACEEAGRVNGAVMMSRTEHPLAAAMLAAAREVDFEVREWGTLGPKLISRFAEAHPEQMEILAANSFYPIHYSQFMMMLLPEQLEACRQSCRDSYGMHLWNQMYREFCIPKNLLPPAGSYLHGLFTELLPTASRACLPLATLYRLLEGHRAMHQLKSIRQVLS